MHARPQLVRTKIIATLGPASATPDVLPRLLDAGLDVCRLNFSHGDLTQHERTLDLIRALQTKRTDPICIIGDLSGPKIRLGEFPAGPVAVAAGAAVRIVRGTAPCTADRWTTTYPGFVDEVRPGQRLLIDDGLVRMQVNDQPHADELLCTCEIGGNVSSRKGINLPDTHLNTPALTDKDRQDLAWAVRHDLDYVALSFVREPEDVYDLRRAIKALHGDTPIVIKIEKPEALRRLDELIAATDAVLVARGDLGVETDLWRVPLVQKDLVARCRAAGVPVIVATQMLQSMIDNPTPTRAEVSDVANAVFDQADAVMLSGETAVGKYPVESVAMMDRIVQCTGTYIADHGPCGPAANLPPGTPHSPGPSAAEAAGKLAAVRYTASGAAARAAVQAALDLHARALVVWTATGATARLVAQYRLPVPVIALTYDERVQRRLQLLFGVTPVRVDAFTSTEAMAAALERVLLERKLAAPGDTIVVLTSTRPTTPGATDTVLVQRIGGGGASSK